jgi:hypothetical protein
MSQKFYYISIIFDTSFAFIRIVELLSMFRLITNKSYSSTMVAMKCLGSLFWTIVHWNFIHFMFFKIKFNW